MIVYLLFQGESADGSGIPRFFKMTTDKKEAKEFLKKYKDKNPYSYGKVIEYTETTEKYYHASREL